MGYADPARLRFRFRSRLPAEDSACPKAVDPRWIHCGLGRWQPERLHSRHLLSDSSDAPPLRALSVLQHDEHRRRLGALILRPHPKVTVSNEFHSLRLTDPNDLWYSGGGAYQPWTFGYTGRSTSGRRSLANLYDSSVEYRANRHVTTTAYLGICTGFGRHSTNLYRR